MSSEEEEAIVEGIERTGSPSELAAELMEDSGGENASLPCT